MRVQGITIAATNTDEMVSFYQNVFDIDFQPEQSFGSTLYRGSWNGIDILICPNTVANVKAEKNRIQFDLSVSNMNEIIELVKMNGGELLEEPVLQTEEIVASIKDPDRNTIVFRQKR